MTQEVDIFDSLLADPETVLVLVDSADTEERLLALEVLGKLLGESYKKNSRFEINNSLKVSVCFAILTRCDDVAPAVRSKALSILSQTMKYLLQVLKETENQRAFECEIPDDVGNLEVNGNHRYFWYSMISYEQRRNELVEILHRRIEDSHAFVRKSALKGLENLLLLDDTFFSKDNLKCMRSALNDSSNIVRKQLIKSVTTLLREHKENSQIQELWLKCILPLIDDTEDSVQSKALLVLEDLFLQKLFSPIQAKSSFSLSVLKKLSSGAFLMYDRFLKKAFCLWKSMDKLKTETVIKLMKLVGTDSEECVWFYLSYFASYCPIPFECLCECIEKMKMQQDAENYHLYQECILKILLQTFQTLPLELLDSLQISIQRSLRTFSVSVELVSAHTKLLQKIHKFKNTESEFAALASEIIQVCQENLLNFYTNQRVTSDALGLMSKCICIMAEFCHLYPSLITSPLVSLLKKYSPCIEDPATFSRVLPLCVKAHAFTAMGRLSLHDENLATEILPAIVKLLLLSKDDVIRSNSSIILIDLCKRYTSYADKYIPFIVLYLKDKLLLIRYQTAVLLANLLRDRLIRWQVPLFFGLLSTLVDEQEVIRQIGQYSLDYFMPEQKKIMFFDCFIDSIFVFNVFEPPDNEKIALNVRMFKIFSMPGEKNRKKRMVIYRYLLESSNSKKKLYLVKAVCEILVSVAESVYPLSKRTECIIRDCFAILMCDEIRIFNINDYENLDETLENDINKIELSMRRLIISDSIIPVIVSLKNIIRDPKSDLMRDIILLLKELLRDYKDDYKDILGEDKVLLKQLELEMKNDAENARRLNSKKKELLNSIQRVETNSCDTVAVQEVQNNMDNVDECIQGENKTKKRKQRNLSPPSGRLT